MGDCYREADTHIILGGICVGQSTFFLHFMYVVCRDEGNTNASVCGESVLSFHYVEARDQIPILGLGSKRIYLLSYFTSGTPPYSHRYIPINKEFPSKISNIYYYLLFFLTHSLSSLGDCSVRLPHDASVRAVSGFMRWG